MLFQGCAAMRQGARKELSVVRHRPLECSVPSDPASIMKCSSRITSTSTRTNTTTNNNNNNNTFHDISMAAWRVMQPSRTPSDCRPSWQLQRAKQISYGTRCRNHSKWDAVRHVTFIPLRP